LLDHTIQSYIGVYVTFFVLHFRNPGHVR